MRFVFILSIILSFAGTSASAAELRLLAATALKDALAPLLHEYETATGHKVRLILSGTVASSDRIRRGEVADVVLIGAEAIDALVTDGLLQRDGRRDIARSGLGAAVRAGLALPDISSEEAMRRTIGSATSLAFSRGPSGEHVERLLARLGLSDVVAERVRRPGSGAEVAQLVASGGAEFGVAQVSEFMGVQGVADLGPLPPSLQAWTVYAAAVHGRSSGVADAMSLIAHLSGQSAGTALRAIGMEPAR